MIKPEKGLLTYVKTGDESILNELAAWAFPKSSHMQAKWKEVTVDLLTRNKHGGCIEVQRRT